VRRRREEVFDLTQGDRGVAVDSEAGVLAVDDPDDGEDDGEAVEAEGDGADVRKEAALFWLDDVQREAA